MSKADSAGGAPVALAGRALAGVFGPLAAVRRTKPLHPRGEVRRGVLVRTGSSAGWDVPWLDEPGSHRCLVRLSRSVGLPDALPDVLGLALRFEDEDGAHDLLLASSARPPVLRHVFLPHRDPATATFTSCFPYATPRGPVVLGAFAEGPDAFVLSAAAPLGRWQDVGRLVLEDGDGTDELVDLDAVLHPLPGLPLLPALAALREPSYAAARHSRLDSSD